MPISARCPQAELPKEPLVDTRKASCLQAHRGPCPKLSFSKQPRPAGPALAHRPRLTSPRSPAPTQFTGSEIFPETSNEIACEQCGLAVLVAKCRLERAEVFWVEMRVGALKHAPVRCGTAAFLASHGHQKACFAVNLKREGRAGFCWGAPLSHIDQSGCWRKKFRNFLKSRILQRLQGVAGITTDSTKRKAELIVYCCRLRYLDINEGADVILENCTVQLATISRLLRKYRPVEGRGAVDERLLWKFQTSKRPAAKVSRPRIGG